MSFSFQFTRIGYVAELDELRYQDATGDYDADRNPGGWGGPNPARASQALFLLGELVRSDGEPGLTLLPPEGGDPLSRTDFALRPGADGLVRAAIVAIPAESRAQLDAKLEDDLIAEGDLYYDRTSAQLIRCLDRAFVPAALADIPYGAYRLAWADEALTPRAQALRNQLTERVAALYYDGQPDAYQNAGDQHLLRLAGTARALLAAADICWQRNQPYLFALRVERLNALSGEAARLLA